MVKWQPRPRKELLFWPASFWSFWLKPNIEQQKCHRASKQNLNRRPQDLSMQSVHSKGFLSPFALGWKSSLEMEKNVFSPKWEINYFWRGRLLFPELMSASPGNNGTVCCESQPVTMSDCGVGLMTSLEKSKFTQISYRAKKTFR